ncbi:hypothetical protein [uncultured Aquimarina sp.]|uniref:hypothetical protein n=1 Tax=uncultured Aquimarina sp. TaxID=575652 RepID=UPI00260CFCCB|nr:hypothetical protein [uncultured Aquimarina sp.]
MKMTYKMLLSILTLTMFGCKLDKKGYTLVEEDGILVEVFDESNKDENRYTQNNKTFRDQNEYIYSYKHINANDQVYLFEEDHTVSDRRYSWKFVPVDSINNNTIQKISIKVRKGLFPMIEQNPEYNQTIIQYEYLTSNNQVPFNSVSGLIENEKNIWMHPPRDKYFRILELNPFPFIKAPYKVGNKWNWNLKIGSAWGDKRWKVWQGGIENKYDYEIVGKKRIKTKLGELECFEIYAYANNKIGKTELTALFSKEYGFVRLNYVNIDKSKTVLSLTEFKQNRQDAN